MENKIFERLATFESLFIGWSKVLANAGAPGGDGVSVHDFSSQADHHLHRLAEDIRFEHYRPGPIRRTSIPKRSGGVRPLSIPSVRDRIVQSALHILLEPILEREFSDSSFGYRPGRGVTHAITRVQDLHAQGFRHVVDADIKRYFENVPHHLLLDRLGRIINEPRVTRLVNLWLSQEKDGRGLPQGSPISPILSNLYLDHLDDNLNGKGVRLVRFADDFVILCRSADIAQNALGSARRILEEIGLQLNVEKTRLLDFNRGFQFLGKLFVKSMILAGSDDERVDPAFVPRVLDSTVDLPATPYGVTSQADASVAVQTDAAISSALYPTVRGDALPGEGWTPDIQFNEDQHDLSPILRPLYLLTAGRRLGLHGETFAVYEENRIVVQLPPTRLGRIEIAPDAVVDTVAMRQALVWGIDLAFVTRGGMTLGKLSASPRHATIHIAQANAHSDPQRKLDYARAFANARIRNQRALLARLNRRRKNERITAAIDRIGRIVLKLKICATPDAVRGVEGEAAALYWPAYGQTLREEFAFQRRRREPAETEVDTMLSVASSTLSRDIAALLLRHGLHTGIAYLHEDRDQLDPLAWDFIEIFRAALVEGLVAYAINNRVMVPSHFGRNETGAMTMDTEGRERFVRTYEAWLNRPITNRRSGTESLWRGLIEDEIIAFRDSLLSGATFTPYLMDY